jgi:hypothetical protein
VSKEIEVVCMTNYINGELCLEGYGDKQGSIKDGFVEISAVSSDKIPPVVNSVLMAKINENYLKRPTNYAKRCRENDRQTQLNER